MVGYPVSKERQLFEENLNTFRELNDEHYILLVIRTVRGCYPLLLTPTTLNAGTGLLNPLRWRSPIGSTSTISSTAA